MLKELAEAGKQKLTTATKNLVENTKLKMTFSNQQKNTDKLFTRLMVDKVETNLFENAQFGKWVTSVSKSYSKSPEAGDMAMVVTLTARYGDEALASMLAAAKDVPSTQVLGAKLMRAQDSKWITEGKTADDVFKLLKLDETTDDFLKSPSLTRWTQYVKTVSKENPYEMLYLKLSKRYNEEELANLLVGAKNELSTKNIARDVEVYQLKRWTNSRKTENDVYKMLKLQNEEPTKLLQNPALNTWISYVKTLNDDPYDELLWKLAKHYNDNEKLADFIFASKNVPSTNIIADKLEKQLPILWLDKRKSAEDVFTLLKLKNMDEANIFENSRWNTWVDYLSLKPNPDETMFMVLKKHYGDGGLSTLIENAKKSESTETIAIKLQEEVWRKKKFSANDVFQHLELSYEGGAFLTSPALSAWISYATKLGKINQGSRADLAAITELEKHIHYDKLARMIGDVMYQATQDKNVALQKVVGTLQKQQFKQWKRNGWGERQISQRLGLTSRLRGQMTAKNIHIFLQLVAIAMVCTCTDGNILNRNLDGSQNEIHRKPHLRFSTTADQNDDTSEDRVFGVTTLKNVAATGAHMISSAANNFVSDAKLKMMQQSTNRMFNRVQVGTVNSNFFESAQFNNRATSVQEHRKSNAAIVVTLPNRYGDETLACMLTAAKEVPDTKDIALNMLKAQIDNWVVQKTPADEVFKILKLDKAGYKPE
ncbi:RxLR effector protein, partial [Phytophthora megakarya]